MLWTRLIDVDTLEVSISTVLISFALSVMQFPLAVQDLQEASGLTLTHEQLIELQDRLGLEYTEYHFNEVTKKRS